METRNKGQAGMGGRGKNKLKSRTDQPTRRKVRNQKIAKAKVPGAVASKNPARRNQKRNQRSWHSERAFKVKKTNRAQAGA
jgi:hypothetical protein